MFKKLVAIEPVNLVSQAEEELRGYAGEITLYEVMWDLFRSIPSI